MLKVCDGILRFVNSIKANITENVSITSKLAIIASKAVPQSVFNTSCKSISPIRCMFYKW